jgi:hypothetical protein
MKVEINKRREKSKTIRMLQKVTPNSIDGLNSSQEMKKSEFLKQVESDSLPEVACNINMNDLQKSQTTHPNSKKIVKSNKKSIFANSKYLPRKDHCTY